MGALTPQDPERRLREILAQDSEERQRIKELARTDLREAIESVGKLVGLYVGDVERVFGPILFDLDD
jgi:hypothetical protein